ncbi:MAG: hypothetical protein EGQ00_04325 [Parabacteroides johnsonii]|nr:hypothetical protein [Parabacteroides johnsonii]
MVYQIDQDKCKQYSQKLDKTVYLCLIEYESLFCHGKDGKLQEITMWFHLSERSHRKAITAEIITNKYSTI